VLRKLGRDVAIYGGADLLFKLAAFAVIPVYAHLLSVAEFGLMALLTISAALFGFLVNLGVNNAMHRFYFDPKIAEGDKALVVSTAFFQLLLANGIGLALGLLLLGTVRDELASGYGIEWLWAAIVLVNVLPEQVAQFTLDAVRLHFTPWRFVVISLVKNLAGILLGLWLLAGWGLGLTGIFLGTLVASTAAVPLGLWMIRRDLRLRIDPRLAKAILAFGSPFVFASAAYWVFGSMDRWLLMEMSTPDEVGRFSLAFKFAAVLSFVIGAFGQAWSPHAMRMMGEDPDYRARYSTIFSVWFFLLALCGLALALFSTELVVLATPIEYWGAAPMLSLGAAGMVLFGTTQITALGITLEKRTLLLSAGAWLAALANVGLNLLLIPRFGGTGAAVATLFSYAILTGSFLFWSQRLHPLPLEKAKLLYCCLIVAAAATVPLLFPAGRIDPLAIAAKAALLLLALAGGLAVRIVPRNWRRRLAPGLAAELGPAPSGPA
jgi:O-antigen/teichoic acid export membrane protein